MPQEAVMIAVDNSDYMRNGDFNPTRLQAQTDAVMMVCSAKRQANIENSIGLMTMASKEVLSTLTSDYNKLLPRLHTMALKGNMEFCTAIRIAHLALKLRQARHQKMRIVAFVGSPIEEQDQELVTLAKRLRKEKVSVDIVNFGEDEANSSKLQVFIDTLNGSDGTGSHLVTVPAGTMLSQSLMTSPIVHTGDSGMSAGMSYEMEGAEDPDLLYALRVSMEDQRMRQEAESGAPEEQTAHADQPTLAANQGTSEEAMLQQALSLSLQGADNKPAANSATPKPARNVDFANMSEDEQIALALQMSLENTGMDVDEHKSAETPTQPRPNRPQASKEEEKVDAEFLDDLVKGEEKKDKN